MEFNKLDLSTEKYIINKFVSMPKLFDDLDIDYNIQTTMYCPFHENYHSKAAKLYHDNIGYRLWCFSERKNVSEPGIHIRYFIQE